MKILNPKRPAPSVMRGACQHCGCAVECHPSEPRRAVGEDGTALAWVSCPLCFRNLYVAPHEAASPT